MQAAVARADDRNAIVADGARALVWTGNLDGRHGYPTHDFLRVHGIDVPSAKVASSPGSSSRGRGGGARRRR